MEASVTAGFLLEDDFSPAALTFLPGLNCVLASSKEGDTLCIDVVNGVVQTSPDIAAPSSSLPSPVLVSLHGPTQKVVVASSCHVGGRSIHKGCVLIHSILQPPARKKDDRVCVEIPAEQVQILLRELLKGRSSQFVKEITAQLSKAPQLHNSKLSTVTFNGNVGKLYEHFNEMLVKMKSSASQPSTRGGSGGSGGGSSTPSILPLISSLVFRLQLLHPDHHTKLRKLETGDLGIGMAESKLMNVEAIRKLSLCEWPHDYNWATPRTMAEAGFYHLAGPQGSVAKGGDRVTCFSCRVYLYSWEPTDEPWSEHERHAIQCPYIRGEITDNVSWGESATSCPAYRCVSSDKEEEGGERGGGGEEREDKIICLGTSMGTQLLAVGTEQGRMVLLDMGRGMLLMEHAAVCLTVDLLNKWLKQTKTATTLHQHPLDGTATAVPTKNEIPAATGATPGENSLETRTKGEDTPVLATGDLDTAAVPSLTTPSETTASGASDIAIPSTGPLATPSGDATTPTTGPLATPSGDEATPTTGPLATPSGDEATPTTGPLATPSGDEATPITGPLATPSGDEATPITGPLATPSGDGATLPLATPSGDEATPTSDPLATPSEITADQATVICDAPLATPSGYEATPSANDLTIPVGEATPSVDPLAGGMPSSDVATPIIVAPATAPEAVSTQPKESSVASDVATPATEPEPSLATPLTSADSDHPRSKHTFHITALSVFAPPNSEQTAPAKTKSPNSSPSAMVTGVTVSRPHGLLPVLLVHRVNSKASPSPTAKPPPIPVPFSATPENLLDFADAMSNPIPLSTSAVEDPVTVDFVAAVPLEECLCVTGSGCMPEVHQVVPLAGGTMLAVTCSTTDEENKKCVVLMLYQVSVDTVLLMEPLSAVSILSTNYYICPVSHCGGPAGDDDDADGRKADNPLLAGVSSEGEVVLYSCSVVDGLSKLCSCSAQLGGGGGDVATGCTYCPTTLQLLVAFRGGTVASVKFCKSGFLDQIDAGPSASIPMPPDLVERDLSSEDFDHVLDIVGVSPVGVPFSCSSQACWKEISLLQLNRRSPLHMNMPPTHAGIDSSVADGRNGRILQYTPPLETLAPSRHTFELVLDPTSPVPIGNITISLSFANTNCILNSATLSLHRPKTETKNLHLATTLDDDTLLCGPIKLKQLVNVTDQLVQVFFAHPALLHAQTRVLLLVFEDLFSSDYKEVSFVESSSGALDAISRRQAWRNRAFRHQLPQVPQSDSGKIAIPVQAHLRVCVRPLLASPDRLRSPPISLNQLTSSIHHPPFLQRVTVAACGGRVEGRELRSLPEPLQLSVTDGAMPCSKRVQEKALDVLMWAGLVHCSSAEGGGYALMSDIVGRLLVSLIHACFVEGDRLLSHKCSQLIIMLYRFESECDSTSQFRFILSESLTHLLPLLPLFSSASCVHWFLRLLSTLTMSCDFPNISSTCQRLLVDLSQVLSHKNSLPAQILQTNFKHEGSVFEPELFDIYLSYCQKSSSVLAKSKTSAPTAQQGVLSYPTLSSYASSSAISAVDLAELYPPPNPTTIPVNLPSSYAYPSAYPSASQTDGWHKVSLSKLGSNVPAGTTHIVTDKGGHTIYDSELKLLLDSKKAESQGKKFIDDFTTYKHGSFLLYSQRGLLETLPLSYICLSVTGNASVLEPNIHTLPHVPDHQAPHTQISIISKSSGYRFPSADSDREKQESSSSSSSAHRQGTGPIHPLPQVLTDIATVPKELMMQVESLKSGVPYSALLKFPQPVALTDISIPATGSMSSVSVDVWLDEKEGEKGGVRVAQSIEIKSRSLMLGNLTPPPVCQYVKVTFLSSLTNTREVAQVFIGAFYGIPLFPADLSPSIEQLQSLEEWLLSQYYQHRDSLTSALLSYASLQGKALSSSHQYEEKVNAEYQQCFKMQVSLSRLRNFTKKMAAESQLSPHGCGQQDGCGQQVYRLPEEACIDYSHFSISKLSKMVGCLVDTLLALSVDTRPSPAMSPNGLDFPPLLDSDPLAHARLLTEDECRVLFYTLCIHGIPKMHARATALLIKYGGSQSWWGRFVIKVAADLFGGHQTAVFNKERALLQLSALAQHTHHTSDLLSCMLTFLSDKLAQFTTPTTTTPTTSAQATPKIMEHSVLRWVVMLLSHFLSSVTTPTSQCSLFAPLATNPPSGDGVEATPTTTNGSGSSEGTKEDSKHTLTEMHKEVKKMLGYAHTVAESSSEFDKQHLKQHLESKMKEYRYLRQRLTMAQRCKEVADSPPDPVLPGSEVLMKASLTLARLPQELCQAVVKGLLKYVLALCASESDVDFIPVISKCASLLLSATDWCYPLHTLISQQELCYLLSYSTSVIQSSNPSVSVDAANLATSLEWRRRALQNLCLSVLYHGEVRPCLDVVRANAKKAERAGKAAGATRGRKPKPRSASLDHIVRRKKVMESREKKAVSSKISPVHYRTFIISNSVEYRRWLMPDSTPERQLQKIAKGVYGSILLSLLNARPLVQSRDEKSPGEGEGEKGVAEDIYLDKLECLTLSWAFPETLSLFVSALEDALQSATTTATVGTRQPTNRLDLPTTLSFWHEINEVLAMPVALDESLNQDHAPQVTSTRCCRILVDYLLSQTKLPPTVWQASLTNLLSSLQHQRDLFNDYDKLLSVLVRFFTTSSCVTVSGLVPRIVSTMLGHEQRLVSERRGYATLSGDCLLLEVIITALQGRDAVAQDHSLLHELCKTLSECPVDSTAAEASTQPPSSPHVFGLIHQLCHLVVRLLPEAFSENTFPGVKLYGSEFDDISRRSKHYTSLNDMYKRSWSHTSTHKIGLSDLTSQLLQLLTKLFSEQCSLAPPPTASFHAALQQFCLQRFARGGEKEEEGDSGRGDSQREDGGETEREREERGGVREGEGEGEKREEEIGVREGEGEGGEEERRGGEGEGEAERKEGTERGGEERGGAMEGEGEGVAERKEEADMEEGEDRGDGRKEEGKGGGEDNGDGGEVKDERKGEEGESRGERKDDSLNFLKLANPQTRNLSLVYADSELLFEFLQILNLLTTNEGKTGQAEVQLYEEFVLFLYNNCRDRSCFFEPIRRVLGTSPVQNSHLSKLFISLITNAPSYQDGQDGSKVHETAEFIRRGGGMIVLNSLIASSRQAQFLSDSSSSFSIQSIHKLGQKDAPLKPINDSTELVDFLPHSYLYRSSTKGTGKVAPNNNLRSLSLFQHTYSSGEKWVQLHVVLPHPILLCNVIACVIAIDSASVAHGGPSKMLVECSAHGGPNSCTPVTPVFVTDSLKIVNIAFRQPVLTQHMVVHFHRPLLSNTVVISKMEVLGTSFGANAQSIAPPPTSATTLPAQQNQEHQGAGWVDIVDQWLHSSVEAVQSLKALFGQLPDLLPACLSLLKTARRTDRKFTGQVENLLIAMAEECSDHGMTILHYLFGFSSGEVSDLGASQDKTETSAVFSVGLLSKLCDPTSDVNKQRLAACLRLISHMPPSMPPPTSRFPSLVCTLSSMIWNGEDMPEEICLEETFRSLVELAFSLEPGTHYKVSLNSLLCALCRVTPRHYSLLLSSCEDILFGDAGRMGHRLNTLALASQSSHCMQVLLGSDLVSRMVSRLTNGFEKLLDLTYHPPVAESAAAVGIDDEAAQTLKRTARDMVAMLCSLLAFFTDFLRNWRSGKEWMASMDGSRFWPPMIEFLSLDSPIVSPLEASFVQEVAYEFFSVALLGCDLTKRVFVQLVCSALCGQFHSNSTTSDNSNPVLTPFLHKLLVGLIFQHESLPLILDVLSDQGKGDPSSLLSLPTTCEVLEFHPSYPVSETCYYIRVPGHFSLSQLEDLVKSHRTSKPTLPSKPEKKLERLKKPGATGMLGAKPEKVPLRMTRSVKLDEEALDLDVTNFKLKDWVLQMTAGKNGDSSNHSKAASALSFYVLSSDWGTSENVYYALLLANLQGEGRMCASDTYLLRDLVPRSSNYPMIAIMDSKSMLLGAQPSSSGSTAQTDEDADMYNMLVACNGLLPLAKSIPPLYPYLWPSSMTLVNGASAGSQGLRKAHVILGQPMVASFRSMVMLGQCLQLEGFCRVLGENPTAAYLLMKLLLGEDICTRDSIPKASIESLSYLPYLVILEALRKTPAKTEAGRQLRIKVAEVGVLQLVLQCLSVASHHSPRVEGEGEGGAIVLEGQPQQPKNISSSFDKQYWAKGTGFGTGSTTSSYNMIAIRAKHKSEEKYVSICFAILTEYLSWSTPTEGDEGEKGGASGGEEEEEEEGVFVSNEGYCTVEVIEMLCRSCMLPALASYLLNDSVLDICKHIELYQTMLNLVSSLARNPATQHLLTLPVFSAVASTDHAVTSLSSLLAKLREIGIIYLRTAKLKPKGSTPSKKSASPTLTPPEESVTTTASIEIPAPKDGEQVLSADVKELLSNWNTVLGDQPPPVVEAITTGLVTSTEIDDGVALIPQLSMVYGGGEGGKEGGEPVEVVVDVAEEGKAGVAGESVVNSVGVGMVGQSAEEGVAQEENHVGVSGEADTDKVLVDVPLKSDDEEAAKTTEGEGGADKGAELNQDGVVVEEEGVAKDESSSPEDLDPETLKLRLDELHNEMEPLFKGVGAGSNLEPEALKAKLEGLRQEVKSLTKGVKSNPEKFDLQALKVKLEDLQSLIPQPAMQEAKLAPLSSYGFVKKDMPPLPPRGRLGLYRRAAKAPPKLTSEETDLVELVRKILSVSEEVAAVVKELKRESGHYSRQASTSTPLTETPLETAFAYVKAMKSLQFDTYPFTYEDDSGKIGFTCSFHYQTHVEGASAASQDASRSRRLAQEISTLSTSLPISSSSTVFVRCDEERLDVMKVLITGPSDTPYANGCFEFDVFFPKDYPKSPMLVNLKTTGHGRVRFNPNLYNDGKVCLSVLNTWHGRPEEKWNGQTSSLLQVLVSIQSLILVAEPYFNEPGYEQSRGTPYGDQKSLTYSSNISVATIQWAMINQIRNPTPCFKEVILQHFYLRKDSVLSQCEAWRAELQNALKKTRQSDSAAHVLRNHVISLEKSMETLRVELDKIKEQDFQPPAPPGGNDEDC